MTASYTFSARATCTYTLDAVLPLRLPVSRVYALAHHIHNTRGLAVNKPFPCHRDPDLFFAGNPEYEEDRSGTWVGLVRQATRLSALARTICLRECPLAQQRVCAQNALDNKEAYGVWAGVQLPGGQSRKIPMLEEKRAVLRRIAAGDINPSQLPDNAALLNNPDAPTICSRPGWIPQPDTAAVTADIA
jgi:WhiB family transcriptional regulator, redox-sensing transcriptional regulator